MVDLLSSKARSGDLCINLARQLLQRNEWGLAMRAIERGFAKGSLSEPDEAAALLQDICQRLGIQREALALTLPTTEQAVTDRARNDYEQ
ncbi:MAG: hypothetical protein P8Y92_15975 [Halioglobus sp.]|jgi:hypothetical protein